MSKVPIEIMHLITTLERGGAENQLRILVDEQISHGHKVVCVPLKGLAELDLLLIEMGAEVLSDFRKKNFFLQIRTLRKVLKRKNRVVIHAHLSRAEILAFLACLPKHKFVITRHNAEPFYPNKPSFSKILSRMITKFASTTIFISKAVEMYSLTQREIAETSTFKTIHYGYKEYSEYLDTSEARRIAELDAWKKKGILLVGTIARLENQKNLITLIRAFKKFNEIYPDSFLIIAGKGELLENLKNFSSQLSVFSRVIFYGRTQVPRTLIGRFDIFVLSSFYEGFGMVLLEATSAKVPILAANNSAIPEVLGEKFDGLFETTSPDELYLKMRKVIENEKYREKLKNSSQSRIANFNSKLMERKIDLIYFTEEAK